MCALIKGRFPYLKQYVHECFENALRASEKAPDEFRFQYDFSLRALLFDLFKFVSPRLWDNVRVMQDYNLDSTQLAQNRIQFDELCKKWIKEFLLLHLPIGTYQQQLKQFDRERKGKCLVKKVWKRVPSPDSNSLTSLEVSSQSLSDVPVASIDPLEAFQRMKKVHSPDSTGSHRSQAKDTQGLKGEVLTKKNARVMDHYQVVRGTKHADGSSAFKRSRSLRTIEPRSHVSQEAHVQAQSPMSGDLDSMDRLMRLNKDAKIVDHYQTARSETNPDGTTHFTRSRSLRTIDPIPDISTIIVSPSLTAPSNVSNIPLADIKTVIFR
jgi:hypothetical protein